MNKSVRMLPDKRGLYLRPAEDTTVSAVIIIQMCGFKERVQVVSYLFRPLSCPRL